MKGKGRGKENPGKKVLATDYGRGRENPGKKSVSY